MKVTTDPVAFNKAMNAFLGNVAPLKTGKVRENKRQWKWWSTDLASLKREKRLKKSLAEKPKPVDKPAWKDFYNNWII